MKKTTILRLFCRNAQIMKKRAVTLPGALCTNDPVIFSEMPHARGVTLIAALTSDCISSSFS